MTGIAYATAHNIHAWDGLATYLFFIAGDLAMGAGLLAVFKNGLLADEKYVKWALVILVVAAALHLLEALQFGIAGSFNAAAIVVAAVIIIVGVFVLLRVKKGGLDAKKAAWILFALAFVAVVVARYAFYAACTF